MTAAGELRTFARYARRLPGFLATTVTAGAARARIPPRLARREQAFLDLLERGVYANPRSPYLALLRGAGAELGDVGRMVGELGVERALDRLYDAGVHLTLDEFKSRRPIERSGVALLPADDAFDNPLATPSYRGVSLGSRGAPRRTTVDLDRLERESEYGALAAEAFGLHGRPFGVFRVIPPNASGINTCLRQLKTGGSVDRWFNPYRPPRTLESAKFALFTRYTVLTARARLRDGRLRSPEYCPPSEAERVARWLAEHRGRGSPAILDTQAALGVRVCATAREAGLDISGSFLRFGGEPYTEAKAAVVAESGSTAVCHYTMTEAGRIGMACGAPSALDDVHLLTDKLAIVQRDRRVDSTGARVGALHYTSLDSSSPKLLLNVESDDYGVLEERSCGCPFGELGLSLHLRQIRSYEKLTSEGIHFLDTDLELLVERVLPSRFGGGPTDYQLVEEEVAGLPKVSIVVHPSVGALDEGDVVSAVVGFLRASPRNRLMAEVWKQSGTLRVVRREPHATAAAKILPLHIRGDGVGAG